MVGTGPSGRRGAHRGAVPGGAEHRARGRDDLRRRAVVAAEAHDADVGEPLGRELCGEPDEERRVGAGEPVDRLVGVADDAEVGAVAEPRPQQPELRRARVLELVDEEMAEAPALRGGELGVALEHVGTAGDEVVEVDEAAACASGARTRGRPSATSAAGRGGVRAGERDRPARSRRGARAGPWPTRSRTRARRRAAPASRPRTLSSGTSRRTLRSSSVGIVRCSSAARRRSCASAMAWNVPAVTDVLDAEAAEARPQLARGLARERDARARGAGRRRRSRACHAMRRVSTRVLPEPAPARIASGAARLVTASRCVVSRPRAGRPLGARYRRGTTRQRANQQPERRRPRVVSAASQLGSPRGRSEPRASAARRRTTPDLARRPFAGPARTSAPMRPPASVAARGWSRSTRSPYRLSPALGIVRTRRRESKRQNVRDAA